MSTPMATSCCPASTPGPSKPRPQGKSSLVLLVSEMKRVFEKDTPLYSRPLPTPQAPPLQMDTSPSPHPGPRPLNLKVEKRQRRRPTVTPRQTLWISSECLICHCTHPEGLTAANHSSDRNVRLWWDVRSSSSQAPDVPPAAAEPEGGPGAEPWRRGAGPGRRGAGLQRRGGGATALRLLEAVRLNDDLSSAQRFLNHQCPVCQEQVSFSKVTPNSPNSYYPNSSLLSPIQRLR
ncbi:hypothetical protein WMY93_011136 [Mugilogobius chulae]|uniref:Uncharacterized protein n=1 Tax=Mugilogobius chulae TaxID=88201 RepID=A0AAW0P342_9GOBI